MEFAASLARELAQLSDRLTAAAARDAEAAAVAAASLAETAAAAAARDAEASAAAAASKHAADAGRLTARITTLTAELDTLKAQFAEQDASGALLRARADELAATNRALAMELADHVTERDAAEATARALAMERQRTAALERERTDLSAALERQRAELTATLDDERTVLTTALERERAEVAASLHRERTEMAAAFARERTGLTAALDRERAEAAAMERERSELTARLERERAELGASLEGARAEIADALARAGAAADSQAAALETSRVAAQEAAEAVARGKTVSAELEREASSLRERIAAAAAALQQAESSLERESSQRAVLAQEVAELQKQVGGTRATFREELAERLAAVFDEIARGTTVEEVLGAAANGLGDEFARVAVLAVDTGRFEPRYQRGFDSTIGVEQMGAALDDRSLLARAARSSELGVHAGASLDSLPFGGSPSLAVTAPVLVRGELFAMIYADNDGQGRAGDATALRLAEIVRRHTSLRLDGLTLELKTIGELRAYARMLLDEVEYVYRADVSARKPDAERVERLTENLRCARQIYQQRRALEAPTLPSLLEEVVAAAIATKSATAFGRELATVAAHAYPEEGELTQQGAAG